MRPHEVRQVAYVFHGTFNVAGSSVSVVAGNRHVRRAGLVGQTVLVRPLGRPHPRRGRQRRRRARRRRPSGRRHRRRQGAPAALHARRRAVRRPQGRRPDAPPRPAPPQLEGRGSAGAGHRAGARRTCGQPMPEIPINIAEMGGAHPDGAASPACCPTRRPAVRQARDVQSGRLRQGPHRRGHARGRRGAGAGSSPAARVVEATSGNTGIALAFVAAARGYALSSPCPGDEPRAPGLLAYGAPVVVTEWHGGHERGGSRPRRRSRATPTSLLPNQFSNPANPDAHRRRTGPRAVEALDGKVDRWSAARGRGGRHRRRRRPQGPRPGAAGRRGRARSAAGALGRPPGPHKIQGIGAGVRPVGARPRDARRGRRGRGRGRDRDRRRAGRGRACSSASPAAPRVIGGPPMPSRGRPGPERSPGRPPSACSCLATGSSPGRRPGPALELMRRHEEIERILRRAR